MTKRLLDLYRSIAKVANIETDDDGLMNIHLGKRVDPVTVKGKTLVLPTKVQLTNPDWSNRIAFNPLSEHFFREESAVLEKFRTAVNFRLQYSVGWIGIQLLRLIGSVADHKKLSPEQSEILSEVKEVDDKTLDVFQKLLTAMPPGQAHKALIHIFLKKGGKLIQNGKEVAFGRIAVVNFPLYNELKKGESEVFGVKMRVKDRNALIRLFEHIFPLVGEKDAYSRGSNSQLAPYMDALMRAVMAVASPFNDTVKLYESRMDDVEDMYFNDDWAPAFENIDGYSVDVRSIPQLNAGDEGVKGLAAQSPGVVVAAAPVTVVPVGNAAMQNALNPQPTVFTPHQPHVATAAIHTERGLNFSALVRSNPAVAAAAGAGMGGYAMPMQAQAQVPRFAQTPFGQPAAAAWGQPAMNPGWGQPPASNGWGAPAANNFRAGF